MVHFTRRAEPRYPADQATLYAHHDDGLQPAPQDAAVQPQGAGSGDIEGKLRAAGIDPTARAEEISLELFCALARELAR